jgi:hypothetical protein
VAGSAGEGTIRQRARICRISPGGEVLERDEGMRELGMRTNGCTTAKLDAPESQEGNREGGDARCDITNHHYLLWIRRD